MINLLPPEYKQDIIYGRRNAQLVRWTVSALISLFVTIALFSGGYFLLKQSAKAESKNAATAQAELQELKLDETQKQVEELSSNMKLTIQVLSKEVLFSELLKQLGASVPANVSLSGLQVDKLQGGLAINANATDVESATQLQLNLQDPKNKIFEKADIESITCSEQSESNYPCTVQIKALFSKNNPFLFITKNTSDGGSN